MAGGLTEAERRALDWLPSDGTWRTNPGRMEPALRSLKSRHPGLVCSEWGGFGPLGGRVLRWKITPAGAGVKAKINIIAQWAGEVPDYLNK
jgi:hypothetical protein